MNKVNNVLWTGGWDSSFRVIQLYRRDMIIQPIYVIDHNRKSSEKELEVIHSLTEKIPLQFNESDGKILPLITILRKDITSNPYLKFIYKKIKKKSNIGKQYYWLATVAKKYKNLEVSLHLEDMDKFFSLDALLEVKDEDFGSNWRINPNKVGFYKRQLFKNMFFPLAKISKPEMKTISEQKGFLDLLEDTWFCHKSGKKPCGQCNPCKQYVRDGFGYRLNS